MDSRQTGANLVTATALEQGITSAIKQLVNVPVNQIPMDESVINVKLDIGISPTANRATAMGMLLLAIQEPESA